MESIKFVRSVMASVGRTIFSDPDVFILMLGGLLIGRKGLGWGLILWMLSRRGDQYAQLFASKLDKIAELKYKEYPYQ